MRGRAAAALLVVALAGCRADADRRVTGPVLSVYASVPLAGPSAAVGRDVLDGERLALAEIRGRVRGHRIRLVTLDSADPEERRTTPARVAVNARRAARDPSTVAYLGEVDPAASAVSVVILNEQGILQLSPADTFSGLTERAGGLTGGPARFYPTHHRTFACLVPDDTVLSAALVERLRRQGTRRLALLDDDGIYGRSLIGEVAAHAVREGLRVVARLRVDPRARRPIAGLVARLRAGRPDAVLFGAEPAPGLPALWRALHTALPRARLVAPAALAVPRFYTGLGAAAPHTELVTPALPPAALGPAARPFRGRFRRRFGRPAGPWAPYGYETMRTLLGALGRAGSFRDRRRVVAAALATRVRASVLGPYALSDGRTSRTTIGFFSVRKGVLALLRRRAPAG